MDYRPHAPVALYTPCAMHDGQREGAIEYEEEPEPMTFGELLEAIIELVRMYREGRKHAI